jgi:hypothetical protein
MGMYTLEIGLKIRLKVMAYMSMEMVVQDMKEAGKKISKTGMVLKIGLMAHHTKDVTRME